MSIYVVELEGYRAGRRMYIKEICMLEASTGHLVDHRFVTIPKGAQIDNKTNRYIYRHIHGIPFNTRFDKFLPRIPTKSLLMTHGIEKARMLQRLYPHCICMSLLHNVSTKRPVNVECPIQKHGPACAYAKVHVLRNMLVVVAAVF